MLLRIFAVLVALALAAAPIAVRAQSEVRFDLAAQPLANALLAVGRVAHVNVTFEPMAVGSRRATELRGSYTAHEALERLLRGSGLSVQVTAGGSFLIVRGNGKEKAAAPSPASSAYVFHLPGQSLAATLQAIRKQTGQKIELNSVRAADRRVPAIDGTMTPLQAVRAALANTPLRVDASPAGGLIIRDSSSSAGSDATTLDTVHVTAKVTGLAATRTATSLREIPQSVSILDEERIRSQNLADLGDALGQVTGVTVVEGDALNRTFYSRGFQLNSYHLDGGAATNLDFRNSVLPDMSEFSHVEVLRGADALFGGAGNPGATVNLVRKRPQSEPGLIIDQQAGTWHNARTQLDATGPIGLDGELLGRVVAMYMDKGFYYDTGRMRKHKLYGIMEYHPTASTTLTLGGSSERRNDVPMTGGLPRYLDGGDIHLPRSTFMGMPWNRESAHSEEAFAQLAHDFSGRWKLKMEATRLRVRSDEFVSALTGPVQRGTGNLLGAASSRSYTNASTSLAGNVQLSGGFDVNGWAQDVLVGADYQDNPTHGLAAVSPRVGPPLSVFDLRTYVPTPPAVNVEFVVPVKQYGGYAAFRLRPMVRGLSIVVGMRDSFYRTSSLSTTSLAANGMVLFKTPDDITRVRGKLTPLLGATYDIGKHYSLYASYASIFAPPLSQIRRFDGSLFDKPIDGSNLEAGIKGEWNGGLLNGSLALFNIRQSSPLFAGSSPLIPSCCYVEGTSSSRGVETELDGYLTRHWQLGMGYTFNVSHQASLQDSSAPVLQTRAPRHLLKFWTNYQLPGGWSRWSVGADLHAQTRNYQNGLACAALTDTAGKCLGPMVAYRATQGFYAAADLRLAYRLSSSWQLAASFNNVFDRTYYQTIGSPQSGSWYGEPRNVVVSLHGSL